LFYFLILKIIFYILKFIAKINNAKQFATKDRIVKFTIAKLIIAKLVVAKFIVAKLVIIIYIAQKSFTIIT